MRLGINYLLFAALALPSCYPIGDPIQTRTATAGRMAATAPTPTLPRAFDYTDRRPIAIVQLGDDQHKSERNPSSWVLQGSAADIDTTTDAGRADFKRRLLLTADAVIVQMRRMDAQGCIVWGIDGGRYGTYLGSPDIAEELNPELGNGAADAFFAKLRTAGKVGVTIRADEFNRATGRLDPSKNPYETLLRKAAYARQRWGCKIFYIDSNQWPDGSCLDPAICLALHRAIAGSLIIPENAIPYGGSDLSNQRTFWTAANYYADAAPYLDMRKGPSGTDPMIRAVVAGGFSCININTDPATLAAHEDDLVAAVRRGDVLMCNGYYADPGVDAVIRIRQRAAGAGN